MFPGNSRKQGAQRSTKQHNVISGIDGSREGRLVRIQPPEHLLEESAGAVASDQIGRLAISVELQKLREQGEDEREGYLDVSQIRSRFLLTTTDALAMPLCGLRRLTRSRRSDTMITRSTRFRVAGSTATIASMRHGRSTNRLSTLYDE